jgi:tellurite resistance protein
VFVKKTERERKSHGDARTVVVVVFVVANSGGSSSSGIAV